MPRSVGGSRLRDAARSLEVVGADKPPRYMFAHSALVQYADQSEELADPEFRELIHRWAALWRDFGWTAPARGDGVPRYLLD
jgi:hypothetical protein